MDGETPDRDEQRAVGLESASRDETDFRQTVVGRRQRWFGFKKPLKRFLSLRGPHWLLRQVVRLVPGLRRSGRLPAPASVKEVEGTVQGKRFVMLRPDRCVVAKELYWGRGRRPRREDDFAIELFASMARRSDVVLDIGAYTGIFTLVAAAVNPEVESHAFEIVPDVYRALFDNCVRNGVLHRVTLHHVGVGDPVTQLLVPAESHGSALPDFYSSRLHFDRGIPVRVVSLDSLLGVVPAGARVLMKVDVEGTENEILANGKEFLDSFAPDILCEVLAGVAETRRLEGLLTPHGYGFHLVRETDLFPASRIQPHARFRDWFFTRRTREELEAMGIPTATRVARSP